MDNMYLTEEINLEQLSPETIIFLKRFVEAFNTTNQNKKNLFVGFKSMLSRSVADVKSSKWTQTFLQNINNRAQSAITKLNQMNAIISARLGNLMPQLTNLCDSSGSDMANKKAFNVKNLRTKVVNVMKKVNESMTELYKAKDVLAYQRTQNYDKSEKTTKTEGYYVECPNPFYEMELLEGNGQVKKTAKATILLLVTFIVVTIVTNALRTFFGGTPGGDFSSPANKVAFLLFSRVIITPFIEEPAKLISIRGGYGKQFFLAFNMVEFGLYTIMMMGGVSLTPIILFRSVAVMMHALTTRIQANSSGSTFSRAWRLAISIVIHFIYNAVFLKFMIMGVPSNTLLLFAIGFFGIAFGLFALVKKKSNNEFTTVGNTEQG